MKKVCRESSLNSTTFKPSFEVRDDEGDGDRRLFGDDEVEVLTEELLRWSSSVRSTVTSVAAAPSAALSDE